MNKLIFIFGLSLLSMQLDAFAEIIVLTENARGEYENGIYTKYKAEFIFRMEINEKENTAILTEVIKIKDNKIIEWPTEYSIVAVEDSSTMSNLLRDKSKKDQKIITLVGKAGTHALEVIMIGNDFFEYTKANAGRFYLSSGTIKRSISPDNDLINRLKK